MSLPRSCGGPSLRDGHTRWYIRKLGEARRDRFMFHGRARRPVRGQPWPLDPTKPMAEAGVPESTMLAIIGHMSLAMRERYSDVLMGCKRETVKPLAKRWSNLPLRSDLSRWPSGFQLRRRHAP